MRYEVTHCITFGGTRDYYRIDTVAPGYYRQRGTEKIKNRNAAYYLCAQRNARQK